MMGPLGGGDGLLGSGRGSDASDPWLDLPRIDQADFPWRRLNLVADAASWIGVVGGLLGIGATTYTALRVKDIERFRAQLHGEGYEHEIRFARLQENRVDVIADLYQKLVDAEGAFANWVHPLQEGDEDVQAKKVEAVAQAGNEFSKAFRYARIWLEEDLCERIDSVNRKFIEVWVEFGDPSIKAALPQRERMEYWRKSWKTISEDIRSLRREIEARFRTLLALTLAPQPPPRHQSERLSGEDPCCDSHASPGRSRNTAPGLLGRRLFSLGTGRSSTST